VAEFAKPIETTIFMPKQHLIRRTCAMTRAVICWLLIAQAQVQTEAHCVWDYWWRKWLR